MPIYEYNGKRYNIPEAKAQELITRMPGAKLIDESTTSADKSPQQHQLGAQKDIYVPQVNQTTFDSEMVRQAQAKQLGGGVTIGQKQNIADVTGDMYGNRELTLPVPKNSAQEQDGFWSTTVGDFGEKIGAGVLNLTGGLAKVHENTNPIMLAARKLLGKDGDMVPDAIPQQLLETGKEVSERGDRYGLMVDPETGEVRKKTYSDLWKEGKRGSAAMEAMLTASESLPTSAMAMVPGAGLTLIGLSVAGQTYNELDNNPETKDLPEWKKILNASASGAIEGLTERLGAKVDMKVFEPVLKKMGEQTVKGILKKGGIGALIQTITEGGEEVISQLGGNVVDYATGVSDEYKPFEGVKDSFVYGTAGGAQFGGVTGAGTIYRAVEQHKANVETAKVQNTLRLWESISKKQSQALPALNNEKQQLEAELGDLTTLSYEEVLNSPESTPELIQARERYDIVNAEYEGVMENLKREVDDFIAPQVQAIQDVAKDGVITELNIGTEEAPDIVYLVKGDVAINEDGTIDPAATSPMLTVKNSEGKKRMIARSKIATAQQDDLNTTIEGIQQRAYEQLVRPVADKLEGKTHFQNGEKVEYTNSKGETVAGTVTAKQNNTVTVVGIDGKKTETFTEDELAQRLVGETIDDVRTRDVIQVQMNGQVYDADVTNIQDGIAELHIPSFPEAAGRYQDVTAAELRRMRVMPQAQVQVDSKTTQETAENAPSTAGQTAQNVIETAETGAESQITPEQQQEQFIASLPKTKEGDIDYDKIEDDDTFITALKSEFPEDAAEIVEEYRKQAEKKLKDAGRVQDPIKKKRAQRAAQAQVDRFNGMYERLNPKAQYQARVAGLEEGTIRERESKMGEYLSLRDYLLRNIATGRFKFRWNNDGTNKGLAGEILATKNTESERKIRLPYLDNNGYSPESLAEYIYENAGQGSEINPGWFNDDSDIRNEIIDVLLSYDKPTMMIDAAAELHKQPESLEEYYENFVDPEEIFNYEANEVSQNDMLRSLPTQELHNQISDQEVELYFTGNNSTFDITNTQQYDNQNEGTRAGSDRADAKQSGAKTDQGDNSRNDGGREDQAIGDLPSAREITITGERSAPASIEQPATEGAIEEPGRPVEGSAEGVDEQIEAEAAKVDVNPTEAQKQQQFDIIQASNPMQDDVHTGIRSADEILTAEEAFSYHITNGEDATPDFTSADMTEALRTGKVTVYSSYPIENGVFVTPSKMEAQNFAGEGKVYSKNVPVTNVAWIDQTQGQYADVTAKETAKEGRPKGITVVNEIDNGDAIEYGTKSNTTILSIKGYSVADIQEELALERMKLERAERELPQLEETLKMQAIGPDSQATKNAITDNRKIIELTKVTIPWLEKKLMEQDDAPIDIVQHAINTVEKDKISKLEQEADDALKDFLDAFNDLNSDNLGIVDNMAEKQAKMLVAGTKMVAAYTKLGIYRFADMVNRIAKQGVQITDDLLSAIKKAYGAFSAENDIEQLDDMKTVRSFTLNDIRNEQIDDQPINNENQDVEGAQAPKEPWQMTREEYLLTNGLKLVKNLTAEELKEVSKNDNTTIEALKTLPEFAVDISTMKIVGDGYNDNYADVKKAITEGKDVPAEVLAGYPELEKKQDEVSDTGNDDLAQKNPFSFKQESPMAYGRAMKILEKRYRYPDGKVMTRYEWIESLPHGLEVRTVKVAAKNDEGYREELWLNQITITKTEQDYYEYLQQGGMTISDHLAEEERKAIEEEKKQIAEKKAKEEEKRKQNEIAQAKQDKIRQDTMVSALQSTREEFIEIGTKNERDYVESFNNRRRKDSAYERDLAVAKNNLEARKASAGKFYDMANAVYSMDETGNPVRKYNYKVGDKVIVTAWAKPVETTIQEVKGEGENAMYVVEKRDGIHNQHIHYDSIRPAGQTTQERISDLDQKLANERKERILSEGTTFDKPFNLKPIHEIKSVDDILSNIDKILVSLKSNEGNGKFKSYEGFAYGGKYAKNAGNQISGYLMALDVLPSELRKQFAQSVDADTFEKLAKWAENRYNEIDVTESTKQSPKRFEQGSKLNEKEKSDVLKTMKDSYKEMNRERSLEAGPDGNERFVWKGSAEDYMVVSDITGRKVRWYVTMPDGKIAHPTELYPNMTNEDIKSAESSDNYHLQQSEVNYRNGAKKLTENKKSVIDQLQKALDAGLEFVKTYDSSDVRERNPITMIRTNVRTKENPNGMIIPLQEYMANNDIDIPDLKNFDWERYYNENKDQQRGQNSYEEIEVSKLPKPKLPKTREKLVTVLKPVTSNDGNKPVMQSVYFDAENNNVAATNGMVLIVLPGGNVKKSELISARKNKDLNMNPGDITEGRYPNYMAVIPKDFKAIKETFSLPDLLGKVKTLYDQATKRIKEAGKLSDVEKRLMRLATINETTVDIEPLYNGLMAMYDTGTGSVQVRYSDPSHAITFFDVNDDRRLMLVMPIYVEDTSSENQSIPTLINSETEIIPELVEEYIKWYETKHEEQIREYEAKLSEAKKKDESYRIEIYEEFIKNEKESHARKLAEARSLIDKAEQQNDKGQKEQKIEKTEVYTSENQKGSLESVEKDKAIDPNVKPKKGDKIAFEIGGREVKFDYDSFISDKNGTLTYDYFGMKTLKPGEYRIERGGNVINVKQENGSNTKRASTEERVVSEKIEDFGEKIEGAKKDTWKPNESTEESIKTQPLSKTFPRPDFMKLVNDGHVSVDGALILKYLYEEIPSKPRKKYKLNAWVRKVKDVIDVMNQFVDSPSFVDEYMVMLNGMPDYLKDKILLYIKVQKLLGFPSEDINTGKYEIKQFHNSDGYSIVNAPYILGRYKTLEEAVDALKKGLQANKESRNKDEVKLYLYQDRETKKYFIGKKGATGIVRLMDGIETIEEARRIYKEQQPQLQEMWRALKVKPEERRERNRDRIGTDYRKGKNVKPELFSETFGFRGVQFGNWVNSQERQDALNDAFDALMDLSTALGISTRAISLNGELGLAFGARGSGKANAHYEPGQIVINLTKTKGAGSLAHEWWHALDNYFSRLRGESSSYLTEKPRQGRTMTGQMDERIRKEMIDAFKNLTTVINKSGISKRSKELDKTRSKAYWSTIVEMSARAFENFIIEKMAQTNESNDYLANFKELSEWADQSGLDVGSYPYPTKEETETINAAYQELFDTIQEKVDEETGDVLLFRSMDEAGFYSTVEDALEKIAQEKGTAEQFKAMLLKNGAKQAELDWMGWDDFASDINVVTKTDIQNWIDQNRIEVTEVKKEDYYKNKGELPSGFSVKEFKTEPFLFFFPDALPETRYIIIDDKGDEWGSSYDSKEEAIEAFTTKEGDIINTKYSQYVLPGGKNYRELLLTMPQKERYSLVEKGYYWWIYDSTTKTTVGSGFETRYEADEHLKDYYGDASVGVPFKSSHFDEPNILAHVRFDERTVNGERVLFIEEIQSDWAQEGKKKGFKSDSNEDEYNSVFAELVRIRDEKEAYRKEIDPYNESSIPSLKAEYPRMKELDEKENQLIDREYELRKKKNGVPNMPFKKTDQWVNLALRRMMMYAAENGYDRIAWTTGQQQADRYDLSKQVDWIEYGKNENGTYWFTLPVEYSTPSELTEQGLESHVGKDIAKKMIDGEGVDGEYGGKRLQGNDLKVGGKGMIAFYDQIVPKAAKKLAKPFGAQVETINIKNKTFNIRRKNNGYFEVSDIDGNMVMNNVDPDNIDQWKQSDIYVQSIPITDELREIAPGGLPLFRTSKEKANEAYAQREWKRAENAVNRLAKKMGVEVELLETTEGLPKKKATSHGWYDVKAKKITIVMPNHRNSMDVQATLLHEAVGHHGLRELFGKHFNTFLDNVYNNAEEGIRDRIDMIAEQGNFSTRKATEEYLSQLAEDPRITETEKVGGIASFFRNVRRFFFEMLAKAGFNPGFRLSDNELKYILWRSYNNLAEPGRYRSIVDHAKDVAMQDRLKVGNYAERGTKANVAEEPGKGESPMFHSGEKMSELDERLKSATRQGLKTETVRQIIDEIESVHTSEIEATVVNNKQELIDLLRMMNANEEMVAEAEDPDVPLKGVYFRGMIFINAGEMNSVDDVLKVWVHENFHAWMKKDPSKIVPLMGVFSEETLNSNLYKGYHKQSEAVKIEEILAFAIEKVYVGGPLTKKREIRDHLDPIIKQYLDYATEGEFSKRNPDFGRGRGRNADALLDNEGGGREGVAAARKGERTYQQRQANEAILPGNERVPGEEVKRADELFDNIDNLKSVVKDYGGFLGKVFEGAPNRGDMLAYARENGFDKLGEGIEQYLADVEDPAELSRIKELLGVDMPDNALRYMLWRNANPNENTVVWKAKEAVKRNELDENILFSKGEVPSSIKNDKYEQRIRSRHNRGFRSLMYGIEEGWFDRMASLRILQNAITGGKAVSDKANAYMLENQLTSRNTADIRYYTKNLVDPFVKQIHDIFGRNMNAADEYMNAKHGLERNDLMAEEEAKRKYAKNIASLNKEYADEIIDEDTYNEKMEAINGKIEAYAEKLKEEKDYSGLTAIAAERGREDFKAVAQEIVAEIEGGVPKEDIDALWSRVNSATKWILDKQYNAGIMTKDIYEKIRGMYKYYVPLRGFEEVTATDLYEYIDNSPSNFEGTVKKASGRTSKAESPTATIMSMGESGIMQANRNRMKQAFYRLVATNPSNYASIEDVWFVETADGFEERFPDISPTASADEVLEAIADFNNEMAELAAEGKAFQGRNKLDVGVKIMKAQASEHVIRVWIAGEEKVIFINGNPRAAQAINGLVQKDLLSKDNLRNGVHYWSRQMAANFTSRNPAFMVTNLMRDVQFAVVSAAVKEGVPYSTKLAKNVFLVGKTISANVFKDGNKDNAEFQKYWEEFEANGGETGYANLHSIDFNRKYVNKKLREFSDQRDFLKPFRAWVRFMENGNRMIEDMSRFATYVTSRQMGRSIERSVSDAKEITINFNRKGSGGFGANLIHSFYLFSNPALQSMRLMGMLAKNHPVRFTAMLSTSMGAGFMVPMINELLLGLFGDDDDKEKYQNITPWVRRNNLVLYVPGTKGKFITLMLPHELRAFYGIGEMAYEKANGGLRRENMAVETAKQMTAMLPIDPMGGPDWWVPDALKPPYQAYVTNRNFMDRPIYRKSIWNEYDPEWTKAYKGTPELLVEAAKGASDITGGDDVVPGWANANPARAYHMFSGYLGGFMTTYTDMSMIAFNLLTGRDVRANDVPVVNKLIRTSDEKTEELRINSEYFYYIDWIREYEHRAKGYEKRVQDPEYRDKYMDVMRDKEQRMYNFAKGQIALIDQLKDYDEEKANEMKEQFVRKMWEYEDQD